MQAYIFNKMKKSSKHRLLCSNLFFSRTKHGDAFIFMFGAKLSLLATASRYFLKQKEWVLWYFFKGSSIFHDTELKSLRVGSLVERIVLPHLIYTLIHLAHPTWFSLTLVEPVMLDPITQRVQS